MRQNNLSVHSENLLPIIKKWLYSDKDIFIRELISNATDALNKLRVLSDQGHAEQKTFEIHVSIDKQKKTIQITDTGIGMTEEEVEKYIAQIAFSGAQEFVEKYKTTDEKDPIIGHFGLGFYSAYMVASKVEIETKSYLDSAHAVLWSCDGTSSYSIGPGARTQIGTQITLHIDEQNLEYLEESKIRELLMRYCLFMPFPISFNGKPIGNQPPLWLKAPNEPTDKEYIALYRQLFPLDPEPLFWVHLNVDYPFHLKGILFFPTIQRRFEAEGGAIKLFCNRVFVSDNCKDILPDYMMTLRGAIDSPDIPLNVSRSYLQMDQNVRQLSSHIAKKIADRLSGYFKTERDKYIDSWSQIEWFLKLGILQDEKFYDRVKDLLIWKNSAGNWVTTTEAVERSADKKIYYATSDRASSLLQLYKDKQIEVLFASSPIDTAVIQFLEGKLSVTFHRIDGTCPTDLLDPAREKTLLDADGKSHAAKLADFVRSSLDQKDLEVEAKSLASDHLPALMVLDEHQRRMRDYTALTQGKSASFFKPKRTFIVNTNSKLIQAIERLRLAKPEIAKEMTRSIYGLSMLSQREVEAEEIDRIITQQTEILEKLTSSIPI